MASSRETVRLAVGPMEYDPMDGVKVARLRVLLADDHPLVLCGMREIIAADAGLELVAEAGDGTAALRRAVDLKPDVAVLDLWMPGLSGLEVARELLTACPATRVLVLSVHEDEAYSRKLLKMGISGYVLKRSATEELTRAIHAVACGELYLDPAFAHRDSLLHPDRQLALSRSTRLMGLDALMDSVERLRRDCAF